MGFNQININCYLRVIKSRFLELGPKPSLDDFRKMNRRKPFMYGSMFAHCAIANNISEEDAVKHIEEVYKATINQRTIGQGDYAHCDSIELPYDRPDPTKLYFGSIQVAKSRSRRKCCLGGRKESLNRLRQQNPWTERSQSPYCLS